MPDDFKSIAADVLKELQHCEAGAVTRGEAECFAGLARSLKRAIAAASQCRVRDYIVTAAFRDRLSLVRIGLGGFLHVGEPLQLFASPQRYMLVLPADRGISMMHPGVDRQVEPCGVPTVVLDCHPAEFAAASPRPRCEFKVGDRVSLDGCEWDVVERMAYFARLREATEGKIIRDVDVDDVRCFSTPLGAC